MVTDLEFEQVTLDKEVGTTVAMEAALVISFTTEIGSMGTNTQVVMAGTTTLATEVFTGAVIPTTDIPV